jgi:arginase
MPKEESAPPAIKLISMPFHLGRPGGGMAAGPETILHALDSADVGDLGTVGTATVPSVDDARGEIACIFEVNRRLSEEVAKTIAAGAFPLILSGNCNCCLGTVAGIPSPRTAAVWFDAHTDFNTADTTRSGFFDGMAAAVLTGETFNAMALSIPGFQPVFERDVIMAGVRDIEPHERERIETGAATWILGDEMRTAGAAALEASLRGLEPNHIYLHVDLDSIDSSEGRVNKYAAPGGPSLEQVCESIDATFATGKVRAAAVTAYDPESDGDGRALSCAVQVVRTIAAAARARPALTR